MPLSIVRDDAQRRLVVEATGTVTIEEFLAFHSQQVADGTWTYGVLYDGRLRDGSLRSLDVHRLADHVRQLAEQIGPPGPLALLRADDTGFGVGRMYEALVDGERLVAVFRSVDEAVAWLSHPTFQAF